jgi:hypothetical protein
MKGGDIIYVREGDRVIAKGTIKGKRGARAYRFDSTLQLIDPNGTPWAHQIPVAWNVGFAEIPNKLGHDQVTVMPLASEQLAELESDITKAKSRNVREAQQREQKRAVRLAEDKYFRESSANLKIIIRRHNKLSNAFCEWLKKELGITADQEEQRVDVCFDLSKQRLLAELKICYRAGTTKSIREALGQVLEYNHYPTRVATDAWLIVLDKKPSASDREFITTLRQDRSLPLVIGWRTKKGFSFHPAWP